MHQVLDKYLEQKS